MSRSNAPLSPLSGAMLLLLASAALLACRDGGAVRGEDQPCSDQSDCAPYHLVCAAPPGSEDWQEVAGICIKSIPPGSCAFYVREGRASGRFCAD